MISSLEDRMLEERARMRGSEEALGKRIGEYARGSRSREIMEKTLG